MHLVKYRAMGFAHEMDWLQSFLYDLANRTQIAILMYCINQVDTFIARDLVFHKWTKHIENNFCFIYKKVLKGAISTPQRSSSNQVTNKFTESLVVLLYDSLGIELSKFDLYS